MKSKEFTKAKRECNVEYVKINIQNFLLADLDCWVTKNKMKFIKDRVWKFKNNSMNIQYETPDLAEVHMKKSWEL